MTIEEKIKELADTYATTLRQKMDERVDKMEEDNNSHYLIYRVLGITSQEGKLIDVYQNKGRFLYKYAGSFLEEATILVYFLKVRLFTILRLRHQDIQNMFIYQDH